MIALLLRDIRIALRAGGGFGLALAFFMIVIILLPLSVGADQSRLAVVAPGFIWLAALLACLLTLDRIFTPDYDEGTLEILATAPIPLETVFVAKSVAHWVTTGLPLSLVAPILGVFLNLPPQATGILMMSLLVGTPALSMLGGFGGALTIGIKRGGLLLSLLVLPLYIPTLIFGTQVVTRYVAGHAYATPFALLCAVSLGAIAALPFAGAAVLRINLR